MITAFKPLAATLLAVSLLAGCKSDEEKAEDYYQSGLSYLEQGDVDRAMIEFRNVFQHDGQHKEARLAYSKLLMDRGQTREAYSQYLRLVEQYPDTVEARAILARLAIEGNNWEEARRHGEAAIALDPERTDVKAIAAALAYRDARLENDTAAATAAADEARAVLEADPSLMIARRILIDQAILSEDTDAALAEAEAALALAPERIDLQMLKAQLLAQKGDPQALGDQLKAMYERFPENQEVGQALISWYMTQRDFAGAESFLRDQAGPMDGAPEGHLAVVEFLHRTQGPDAALAETEALMAATEGQPQNDVYAAARASLLFEKGQRDEAIQAAEAILDDAEPSDQTRRVRIVLARMLAATGNVVGARAEVEKVLGEDATNTDALKMRAAWLIQSDQPDQAILDLRAALDQAPRDPEILTLMAEAHQRNGSPQLAQERLALAVEVSGNRAPEALRYARFVLQRGRPALAETVLDAARQVSPGNIEILAMLAEIYLRDSRWDAAQDIVATLKQIDGDQAADLATRIESSVLLGQENIEGGLAMMQAAIDDPSGADLGALIQVLRTQVATGRGAEARAYLDDLMAQNPDNLALWLFDASLLTTEGKRDEAEARYRQILETNPQVEPAALQLAGLLLSDGRAEEADAVIDAGISAMPGSRQLRLLRANRFEQTGDIDSAIEVYEELYAQNSSDVVVANNLASLLTGWRDDPESLDRAEVISRRLRGTDVPAFRDTLGWVQYLKGNYSEAVGNLEAAAEGLPNDPNVALHLGLTYAALGRTEEARETLQRGLDLAGEADVPQRAKAEETLASLAQ